MRDETEAGSAGTQPARDNPAEASKRRLRVARWSALAASSRRPVFSELPDSSTARPAARFAPAVGLSLRPHSLCLHQANSILPHSLMRAMPPINPGVRGSAPPARWTPNRRHQRVGARFCRHHQSRTTVAVPPVSSGAPTLKSAPRYCASPYAAAGHRGAWYADQRARPGTAHLPKELPAPASP